MPVLGVVAVDSVDEGINRALDINYAGGTGHTSGIFATDEEVIEKYATAINAGRVIVNSPTSIGGLGGVYNNLNTTLSFGCGTGGGNSTTDNVGVAKLAQLQESASSQKFCHELPDYKEHLHKSRQHRTFARAENQSLPLS